MTEVACLHVFMLRRNAMQSMPPGGSMGQSTSSCGRSHLKNERMQKGKETYFEPCSTASETAEAPESVVFREVSFRA